MSYLAELIVNADDLGFSPDVNEAVLRRAELGTITAASMMVNMPFAEEAAVQVQKRVPRLSIGLHMTLTSGKSVSPPQEIPILVNEEGQFRRSFPELWMFLAGKTQSELYTQIRIELTSQLRLMDQLTERYSLRFDHLDSHQHIHILPKIRQLVYQESALRQIPLRVPRETWGLYQRWNRRIWTWKPQNLIKQCILNAGLYGVHQHIGYFGILESGYINKPALSAIIKSIGISAKYNNLKFGTYEINVHPSLPQSVNKFPVCCSKGDKHFHASPWRHIEFQSLDEDILSLAEQNQVKLTGFG